MSLSDKYSEVFALAATLGCGDLNFEEIDGRLVLTGTCPSLYISDQLWDKVKEIDPDQGVSDVWINLKYDQDEYYGEYEVKRGDTLSGIAKKITHGKLSYHKIFEANRDILDNPDKIQIGQMLKIPKF
jgi:nucleoid-associated protein YgaU